MRRKPGREEDCWETFCLMSNESVIGEAHMTHPSSICMKHVYESSKRQKEKEFNSYEFRRWVFFFPLGIDCCYLSSKLWRSASTAYILLLLLKGWGLCNKVNLYIYNIIEFPWKCKLDCLEFWINWFSLICFSGKWTLACILIKAP